MYPPSDIISYHRVERPQDELPPDSRSIDVAVLDMNHGWHNLGHDAIVLHFHTMAERLRSALAGADLRMRVFSYDVRRSLVIPKPGRFPLLVGTGGPGHINPHMNDGESESSQGIAEDPSWEAPLFELFESILEDESTAFIAICHTYGVLCRWAGIAEPVLRKEDKGGKSAGVVPNVLTSDAKKHPFYLRLSQCLPDNKSLRVTDNRLFDLVEDSSNHRNGYLRLGYESDENGVRGSALTMVEFARDREGVMPRVLGVNHHPEVVGRNYIRSVLDKKWQRGEVTREWHQDRVKTLEKHFSGEYDQQIRITSTFTFLAPTEFHLQRIVRERRESLGFEGALDENMVLAGAEAACNMEAITE